MNLLTTFTAVLAGVGDAARLDAALRIGDH